MNSFYKIIEKIIYVAIGLLVISRGAILYPDSITFLEMAFNHSPVYCLFLKIFTSIFSENLALQLVVITQYSFIVFGVNFLLKYIKEIFSIHEFGLVCLQLILLAPCVYLHFLGSAILSEALTYPLFLVLFRYCLKIFIEENLKSIFKVSLILIALILTRGQFIAFIPVILLIAAYIIYKQKSYRENLKFLVVLLAIPFITLLSEKTYNKIVFGCFVNNSMNYVHLITSPFYISNESDVALFKQKDEKIYFKIIYSSLYESNLLRNQIEGTKEEDYQFYHQNFSNICNKRIYKLGLQYFESKGLNFVQQNIELNKLCSKMVFPLLKQNAKIWLKLFIKNLVNSFGSAKQMLLFIMLLMYGLLFINKINSPIIKFIILGILFMFANNTLVAVPIHSIKRYIFYFDWLIFAIMIFFINQIINHNLEDEH